jgi:hypothetical protein
MKESKGMRVNDLYDKMSTDTICDQDGPDGSPFQLPSHTDCINITVGIYIGNYECSIY